MSLLELKFKRAKGRERRIYYPTWMKNVNLTSKNYHQTNKRKKNYKNIQEEREEVLEAEPPLTSPIYSMFRIVLWNCKRLRVRQIILLHI